MRERERENNKNPKPSPNQTHFTLHLRFRLDPRFYYLFVQITHHRIIVHPLLFHLLPALKANMESDPFFLDWGSSVNVNEDLRRTIRTEINTLDQDLQKLDQSIRTEEKTSSLLHRDFSHAQAELISLKNEVSEEKENAAMNEQFQMKLGESLEKEVVNVISVQREQTGPGESGCESGCESAVELGMAEYVMKRSQEIKHLKMTIQAKKTSLNERLIKVDEVQIQLKDANDRIMKEERNQSVWNDDVEIQQKEFSAESQRMQSVKDSLTKRRKNVGDFTQQRTECVSTKYGMNALSTVLYTIVFCLY
jgi:hypothetical protein